MVCVGGDAGEAADRGDVIEVICREDLIVRSACPTSATRALPTDMCDDAVRARYESSTLSRCSVTVHNMAESWIPNSIEKF